MKEENTGINNSSGWNSIDVEAEQPMTDEELIAELERRGRVSDGKIIK